MEKNCKNCRWSSLYQYDQNETIRNWDYSLPELYHCNRQPKTQIFNLNKDGGGLSHEKDNEAVFSKDFGCKFFKP